MFKALADAARSNREKIEMKRRAKMKGEATGRMLPK